MQLKVRYNLVRFPAILSSRQAHVDPGTTLLAWEQWLERPSRASTEPYQILQGKRGLAGLLWLPDMSLHCPQRLFPSSLAVKVLGILG